MTKAIDEFFIGPLSNCFQSWPGQDLASFLEQLEADIGAYPSAVLSEAATEIRRTQSSRNWPPIAMCLKAVQEAAHRQYQPPEAQLPEPQKTVRLPTLRLDPGGSFLTQEEMRSCPVGTQYWAEDATIRYPGGAKESWGEMRRRKRRAG